jgi:hypothetical protein
VCHRTVSGAPGNSKLNSLPSGKWRPLCYNSPDRPVNAPDSVRCASGATATSRATVDCNAFKARLRAQRSEHTQLAHRTVYRTCPVHHRTAQRPHKSELQWSNPNGWLTWLAHLTVSGGAPDCPVRHATADFQRPHFGGWGCKYPNHPTFNGIQVSTLLHLTRAIAFNTRHTKEIKSSPNSTQSFSD